MITDIVAQRRKISEGMQKHWAKRKTSEKDVLNVKTCEWKELEKMQYAPASFYYGYYIACNNRFHAFFDRRRIRKSHRYCPYCGKIIKIKKDR
jgi:predicted SPOUT superfamily RNA methylase MTH1